MLLYHWLWSYLILFKIWSLHNFYQNNLAVWLFYSDHNGLASLTSVLSHFDQNMILTQIDVIAKLLNGVAKKIKAGFYLIKIAFQTLIILSALLHLLLISWLARASVGVCPSRELREVSPSVRWSGLDCTKDMVVVHTIILHGFHMIINSNQASTSPVMILHWNNQYGILCSSKQANKCNWPTPFCSAIYSRWL